LALDKWRFILHQLSERLWLRATLYAVLGVGAALVAAAFSPFVPSELAKSFGGNTVNGLLNVLATSLLAVATFSVAAMLTAYTNVSQGTSPRAASLITGDARAQSALATFIGAFLYSVVAFSANGTGYYGSGGRAIVFFVTLVVLALVAANLLQWLDQLLSLARVGHAIWQVEKATLATLDGPFGRAAALRIEPPASAERVFSVKVGYVQNVDLGALAEIAEQHGIEIWVEAPPGAFAEPSRLLLRATGPLDADLRRDLRDAFTIGLERSFSQDTRFGLIVMGQIASKALSPGINDPGTAIDVAVAATRLLQLWLQPEEPLKIPPPRPGVNVSRPAFADLLRDVFGPMAIDGASSVSVTIRIQRCLTALACIADAEDREMIRQFAHEAIRRSDSAMSFDFDRSRVHEAGAALLGRAIHTVEN
jgi:uncharacterized membrane protein